ncbi:MAG: hypothetical protein PHW52_03900 [Candidatus Pacebacteria bacterium]|nr:hypothetical protein [Candidatus Paceibacterota bacterium]
MKKVLTIAVVLLVIVAAFYIYQGNNHKEETGENKQVQTPSGPSTPSEEAVSPPTGSVQKQEEEKAYSVLGKWESLDDPASSIEFNGGKMIDYYQGEKMSEGAFTIKDDIINTTIDGEVMQYEIVSIDNDKLVLSYLARGNTLNYKKIK